jgi:hypothetical protein
VTKGGVKANCFWAMSQQNKFKDLKFFICLEQVLILLDLQHPVEIEIDSSYYVIGVVLTQHGDPVEYHSEKLSDFVHRYPTYDENM